MFAPSLATTKARILPALTALAGLPHWAILLGIASFLRFINLGVESIWYDEAFTVWLAKLSLPNMLAAIRGDVHPPLWYLVEWVNVRIFGFSEFALRLPAALLGVIDVLLVWRLAGLVGLPRKTAFVAGLLAALLPGALYYSQDARMYDLLAFAVLWLAISVIKRRWQFFALAGLIAIYSQYLGAFYVLALGTFALLANRRDKQQVGRIILAGLIIVGGWLAWLPNFIYQAGQVKAGFWMQPLSLGAALYPIPVMTFGWRLPDTLQLHVYVIAFIFTMLGLVAGRELLKSYAGLALLILVLIPPLLAALVSIVWRSIYLPRAFLPSIFGLLLLWALVLMHTKIENRIAAWLILIPALTVGVFFHYFPGRGGRFDMHDWVNAIRQGWHDGDVIYHLSIDSLISIRAYTPDLPYAILPYVSDLNQSLTQQTKAAMGFVELPFNEAVHRYRRIWLVAGVNPLMSAGQIAAQRLILASYPYQVIRQYDDGYMEEFIYLISP